MSTLEERLTQIENLIRISTKRVLSVKELAEMLNVSVPTVWRYVSNRQIPHSKFGKKVFFDKVEVEDAILKNRISTNDEIEEEAERFIQGFCKNKIQ